MVGITFLVFSKNNFVFINNKMSCGKYFRVKWGNRTIVAYNYFKRLRQKLRETIIRIVAKCVLCHQSEVWSRGVCRAALLQS